MFAFVVLPLGWASVGVVTAGLLGIGSRWLRVGRAVSAPSSAGSFDGLPLAVVEADAETGVVLSWNDAAERLFGWTAAEAVGSVLPMVDGAATAAHERLRRGVVAVKVPVRIEAIRRRKDGTTVDVSVWARSGAGLGGRPVIVAVLEDLSARNETLAELKAAATLDPLTGLLNRETLPAVFDEFATAGVQVLVVTVDLDEFKAINDDHGHPAGDAVLIEAARRLRAATRPVDRVFRYGGDEFIALIAADGPDADSLHGRITAALDGDDLHRRIPASVGVALANRWDGLDMAIRQADAAMYANKRANPNRAWRAAGTVTAVAAPLRPSRPGRDAFVSAQEGRDCAPESCSGACDAVGMHPESTPPCPGSGVVDCQPLDAASRLSLVARSLNTTSSVVDVVETILTQGMAMLGADGAVFAIDHGAQLLPIAVHGASKDVIPSLGPIPTSAAVPIAAAARERTAIWVPGPEATEATFPLLRRVAPTMRAWAALPVELDGTLIGVFGFCFRNDQHFDEVHRLYVRTLADISARPLAAALGTPHAATATTPATDDRPSDIPVNPTHTPSELACDLLVDDRLGNDVTGIAIAGRLVPDELWFLATAGYLGEVHTNRTIHLALEHHAPMPTAVATGRPVALRTADEIATAFPTFAQMVPQAAAAIAIPATHHGIAIGALGITFGTPQTFDETTIGHLSALADTIAAVWLAPLITGHRPAEPAVTPTTHDRQDLAALPTGRT